MNQDRSTPDFCFDDNTSFTFIKPEFKHKEALTQPYKLESTILCQSVNLDFKLKGTFKLHDSFLVYFIEGFSNTPAFVLDISHAKLSTVEKHLHHNRYKFRLSKNKASFDFYFLRKEEAENWRSELKSLCVIDGFHDEYELIGMLGKGAFASVYLVEHRATSIPFAVKGFAKSTLSNYKNQAAMISEINMMRKNNHANLINLYEVHESENSIYLVMEFTTGQTLRSFIKKKAHVASLQKDQQFLQITKSILSALSHFEENKIMHRDLKPDNILVDDDLNVKIIDFGLATHYNTQELLHERCGTAGYIAPEVFRFNNKNPESAYNDRCDVFSAGCILFQMLLGFRMFEGDYAKHILKLNSMYCSPQGSQLTKNYILAEINNPDSKVNKKGLDLLLKMLEPDHKKRISASEALKHPYFNGNNFDINKPVSFADAMFDCSMMEERTDISPVAVALNLPKTMTKCLLSLHVEKSQVSTGRKGSSFLQMAKHSPNSSQEDTGVSQNIPSSGTSMTRDLTFERMSPKARRNLRTSLFCNMKKKEETEEDLGEENLDEEGHEERFTDHEAFSPARRLFNIKKPSEMQVSTKKTFSEALSRY